MIKVGKLQDKNNVCVSCEFMLVKNILMSCDEPLKNVIT